MFLTNGKVIFSETGRKDYLEEFVNDLAQKLYEQHEVDTDFPEDTKQEVPVFLVDSSVTIDMLKECGGDNLRVISIEGEDETLVLNADVVKEYKHSFTKSQLNDIAVEGDELFQEREIMQQELDEEKSRHKAEKTRLEGEIQALNDRMNLVHVRRIKGYEMRNAACRIEYDWDKGVKSFYNAETGKRISKEDITDEDRQLSINMNEIAENAAPEVSLNLTSFKDKSDTDSLDEQSDEEYF